MTVAHPDPAEGLRSRSAGLVSRLLQTSQRFVASQSDAAIVTIALGAFVVLWMLYDTVSLWTVDLHWDASEAAVWAQHFAFGYKHPPMTAWLFELWFALFPRADWAAHLQAVVLIAVTLGITWRLVRDHLDRDRALLGLAALILVPLYTFKAAEVNAGTVMMPFWAATLLFYLRARRGLGMWDAALAGAFAGLTLLGKYWAVYLFAGMAVASVVGAGTRRFWRSPAPYLMAAGAAVVIAPHLAWYISHTGGDDYAFLRDSVMTGDSVGTALWKSLRYLLGSIAYVAGPLIFLAALRPSRAALADLVWPADADRQQALVLFAVPLLLPALVNIVEPHRLTAVWTYPNWALLPVVLYGSRKLAIDTSAVAASGLFALAFGLVVLIAAPVVAYLELKAGADPNRPDADQVAAAAARLAGAPVQFYWGSDVIAGGLPFYLPPVRPLETDPLSDEGRAAIKSGGVLFACLDSDAPCLKTAAAFAGYAGVRTATVVVRHRFLGLSGPATTVQITLVPSVDRRSASVSTP